MDVRSSGDMPLVPNRVNEKADLQSLNQRFAAYIQAVRSAQDNEVQRKLLISQSIKDEHTFDSVRLQYEQQIAELQAKVEEIIKEKQELALNRARYDSTLTEYESRVVALNQSLFEKQTEMQRLHGALAAKDAELQEARSDATQPRLALDGARMEIEDLRKRLQESDRRLQLEISSKGEVQQQMSDFQGKMQREITVYQEELSDLRNKLENSHQLTLELEEKVRKAGQTDSSLVEMMKKVREASEAELRRFMEETEAKYSLNIQEVKMRMDADIQNLTALAEENARLQSQIDTQLTDMRTTEAKLAVSENQKQAIEQALENEKSMFQATVRNLEVKLQETQDLLLVKIQELGAAQEANIPLRAEINALKSLIEEEERRLNLDTVSSGNPFASTLPNRQSLTASTAFMESLGLDSRKHMGDGEFSIHQKQSDEHRNMLGTISKQTRPVSEPAHIDSTHKLSVGSYSPNFPAMPYSSISGFRGGIKYDSDNKIKSTSSSSDSVQSQSYDIQGADSKVTHPVGIDELPPRPGNPTPDHIPRRPLSAAKTRFIPASGSQGKDYFDAMFNDVRKDTLYSKVTEDDASHAVSQVSSVHQDYINSTSSMATKSGDHVRAWFCGTSASATGNLKVLHIADDGSSVTISNISTTDEENLGGFMVQQNVGGHLVAVFRFPPRASLRAASSTTVWSGKAVNGVHNPPHHYIWTKLDKWGTGPECTTILCKPNGQAVAWMTSAPRVIKKSKNYKYTANMKQQTEETKKLLEDLRVKKQMSDDDSDVEDLMSEDQWRPDPVVQPTSYSSKPTLYSNTGYNPRPPPSINRPKTMPPSSRTAVSSGLLPSRTGSSPLHLHQPRTTTTHQVSEPHNPEHSYLPPWSLHNEDKDGMKIPDGGSTQLWSPTMAPLADTRSNLRSAPSRVYASDDHKATQRSPGQSVRLHLPGTFWPPAEQHKKGMQWIQSQHNINFLPPMPKAFPCVTPVYR